jgi:uncharacterized damage-inducible protein DinB
MPRTQDLAPSRLADQLERAFRGGAWHGPALMELLADVDLELARWRPWASGHCIAELVGHLTYWLEEVRRQLQGEAPRQGEPGSDWCLPPDSEASWQALLARLEEAHGQLRTAILQLPEGRLDEARSGADTTLRGLLLGTLQHNAYHGGQIAWLRKLAESGRERQP